MRFSVKTFYGIVLNVYKKGFLSLLSANFFTQLIAFLALMYAATVLTPEDIGRIKIMQAFIAVAAILAGLGSPTAILKLCGEIRSDDEKKYILSKSLQLASLGSLVVYLILNLLVFFDLVSKDIVLNQAMQLFGLTIIPFTLTRVIISFLQATRLFNQLSKIQLINGIVLLISVVGLTYYYLFNGFIYGNIAASVLSLVIFSLLVNIKRSVPRKNSIKNVFELIWKYSKYPLWANILGQMILYFDLFLINYFVADRVEIGQYSMAVTFVGALHLLTATVQQISAPYFAEKSEKINEVNALYKKYITSLLLFSLAIFVVAQIAMPFFLNLFFSSKYDDSIIFFRILSLAWLVKSSYALIGPVFIGVGKTKYSFYSILISFCLSLGFYFYFVQSYGLLGAAFGTLTLTFVTSIVVNITYILMIKKNLRVI